MSKDLSNIVEDYNGVLCIRASWLFDKNRVMSKSNYDKLINKKLMGSERIEVVRRSSPTNYALVRFDSLPQRFLERVSAILEIDGDELKKLTKQSYFKSLLQPDYAAIDFFANKYRKPNGRLLKTEHAKILHTNAMFLNTCNYINQNTGARRRVLGTSKAGIWQRLSDIVNDLQEEYGHTLPEGYRSLQSRAAKLRKYSYISLLNGNVGNSNARIVNEQIERLILSLYVRGEKPYAETVLQDYLTFVAGGFDIVDKTTGEIIDRNDFITEEGMPRTISYGTVLNIINRPDNRALVDSLRNDFEYYNRTHRPHVWRHAPEYSLSKISLDDRDLPRLTKDSKGNSIRVKAYYAYDVKSGAVIGASYSLHKDDVLFVDCMRDMFRFLHRHGLGFPIEAEVEHHLVNNFKDDLMRAGVIFPMVRWCVPGNSQEKYAETFNRVKKLGYEKRYQEGVGRFYARLEANRKPQKKAWNPEGMYDKEKTYTFAELIADDYETIKLYNADLHRDQKLYKGQSRMDVLLNTVNPDLPKYNEALVVRYVGESAVTSLRRNQYVQCNYGFYQIPGFDTLRNMQPNNYKVTAYWLPAESGVVDTIYLYQNDTFVCAASRIERFNVARAEWTEKDAEEFVKQEKFITKHDKQIKESRKKLYKTSILKPQPEPEPVEVYESPAEADDWSNVYAVDYAGGALESL